MIRHSMDYVMRAEKVMAQLDDGLTKTALQDAKDMLVAAEGALVEAYGEWRTVMRIAAFEGSELAARYVEESTWDLT